MNYLNNYKIFLESFFHQNNIEDIIIIINKIYKKLKNLQGIFIPKSKSDQLYYKLEKKVINFIDPEIYKLMKIHISKKLKTNKETENFKNFIKKEININIDELYNSIKKDLSYVNFIDDFEDEETLKSEDVIKKENIDGLLKFIENINTVYNKIDDNQYNVGQFTDDLENINDDIEEHGEIHHMNESKKEKWDIKQIIKTIKEKFTKKEVQELLNDKYKNNLSYQMGKEMTIDYLIDWFEKKFEPISLRVKERVVDELKKRDCR